MYRSRQACATVEIFAHDQQARQACAQRIGAMCQGQARVAGLAAGGGAGGKGAAANGHRAAPLGNGVGGGAGEAADLAMDTSDLIDSLVKDTTFGLLRGFIVSFVASILL